MTGLCEEEMNIVVHLITWNEEFILPYTIRHYGRFCSKILVHDVGSTDNTVQVAKQSGAEVVHHNGGGEFNDTLNEKIKNEEWHKTPADWILMIDADEFFYFPKGVEQTLAGYEHQKLPVARPIGFEMLSDFLPSKNGQIYDECKYGAKHPDYCKPELFNPRLVEVMEFSTGGHTCQGVLKDGTVFTNPPLPANPPVYLLHYHQIGSTERIGEKYEGVIRRLSNINRLNGWGIQRDGHQHSKDKRSLILAGLEKVVP